MPILGTGKNRWPEEKASYTIGERANVRAGTIQLNFYLFIMKMRFLGGMYL